MPAPLAHRAVLSHRRVLAAAMAARSRAVSLHWLSVGLFLGLMAAVWAGHAITFWFVQQLPIAWMFAIGTYLPTLVPALLAFFVMALVGSLQNRAVSRAYLSKFDRLGIPREIDAQFELLPDGLRLSTDRITIFPRWHAVDTVERGSEGWVIYADHLTFLVPHDSFAAEAAERAFVATLVGHLTAEARERSPAAVAFAGESDGTLEEVEEPVATPTSVSPDRLKASARISRHEASWAAHVGFDRIAHTGRHAFLYPALSALVGGMLGLVLAGLLLALAPLSVTLGNVMVFAGLTFILPLIGSAIGLWLGYRRLGTLFDKAYSAGLSSRGSPPTADCDWEIADEGLVMRSDRGSTTARWETFSEVFRKDVYWIALADLAVLVIPRRAFPDEAAERAFIAALLARLPDVARERSSEAAAFAAG